MTSYSLCTYNIKTNSIDQSRSWEAKVAELVKFLCSQDPVTGLCPVPDEFNPHHHMLFKIHLNIFLLPVPVSPKWSLPAIQWHCIIFLPFSVHIRSCSVSLKNKNFQQPTLNIEQIEWIILIGPEFVKFKLTGDLLQINNWIESHNGHSVYRFSSSMSETVK
jgi:hypothetical protein